MEILTHNLPESARVLDLGAGGGSFSYRSTPAGVIAIDLAFPDQAQDCFARVVADAGCLPLRDHSIDVVICNNTLEHFDRGHDTVLEIDRVLGSGGHLWVSVPNGFSFDDGLYRFVFKGGGHVNRFTLSTLLHTVESGTHLSAQSYKTLYSGFVYLSPPPEEKLVHFPRRARVLSYFPPRLLELGLLWFNYAVRLLDRYLPAQISQYGWGVVFRRRKEISPVRTGGISGLEEIPADLNVCFSCGSGHPESTLLPILKAFVFWKSYSCPSCGKKNLFFRQRT